MNVGARFWPRTGSPISAVRKTSTSRPAEIAPSDARVVRVERRTRSSPSGSGRPARAPLELRPFPERAEREEREDEDDGAAPEEEPLRDRQVLDAADPVGEQAQGRTSSSAI